VTWRVKRLNSELLYSLIGITFLVIILLSPGSAGWFVWFVPFLVIHQIQSDRIVNFLATIFSIIYAIHSLIFSYKSSENIDFFVDILSFAETNPASLINTALVSIGFIIAMRIWRESVMRNDFFRQSRKPFVIAIAGPIKSGKKTLSSSISSLFEKDSFISLNERNYFLQDEVNYGHSLLSYSNPISSDLESLTYDLIKLLNGESLKLRGIKDNAISIKDRLVRNKDFILVFGCHVLSLPIMRSSINISIFVDMDAKLKNFYSLRNNNSKLGNNKQEQTDSNKYIVPQANYSDIIFNIKPTSEYFLEEKEFTKNPRLKLELIAKKSLKETALKRALIGICGLHVEVLEINDDNKAKLEIEGEIYKEDLLLVAKKICPRALDFIDYEPIFENGINGLMQLIVLTYIDQELTKRFI